MKQIIKTIGGRLALATGMCSRTARSKMTVVAFHRVTDDLPEDGITCSVKKFEAFCVFFRDHFHVMRLSDQVAHCKTGASLAGSLSITFDDGYLDNVEVAAPILQKLGLPATFFVTTSFIGSPTVAAWDQVLTRPPHWMSWDDVRWLVSRGFEIGNHTDTHLNMAAADLARARQDLLAAREKLAAQLGTAPQLFAYPFGGKEHITAQMRDLVRETGFSCCLSCFGGLNCTEPDPFNIRRIGIAENFTSPDHFAFEFALGRV
jgi:peptidoglycan/xylan/chitin deacetylase (PgdA/CDA1 family)